MAEFYCPKFDKIKLPSGRTFQLRRGIHEIPDELANSMVAHKHGIKPPEAMTDAEWAELGLTKPVPPPVVPVELPTEAPTEPA